MSAPGQRQSPFEIVMRGYNRDQVTDHIRRLEAEMRMIASDRDATHAHAAELSARLDDARAQIADLRREVDALSVPPTTIAGMSERVTRMLQLATDEAAEQRADARAEAAEMVSVAKQEAAEITASAHSDAERTRDLAREKADQLITEAEDRLTEAEKLAAEKLAAAESDSASLRGAAHSVALNRLARSRELASAAHDAHRQIIEHLGALRTHLDNLPQALDLTDDERAVVAATDTDDLEILNRTLTGRDRFGAETESAAGRPSSGPAAPAVGPTESVPDSAADIDAPADEAALDNAQADDAAVAESSQQPSIHPLDDDDLRELDDDDFANAQPAPGVDAPESDDPGSDDPGLNDSESGSSASLSGSPNSDEVDDDAADGGSATSGSVNGVGPDESSADTDTLPRTTGEATNPNLRAL